MAIDIYLYGMTVMSTLHMLAQGYPLEDTYGEIEQTHYVPGGEAGNSALILANFGYQVKLDGPYLGRESAPAIKDYFDRYTIDYSGMMYDPDFLGVKDIVLIGKQSRTVFGWFGAYFSADKKRWSKPDYDAIKQAKVVGLDPYFPDASNEVATICQSINKPLVAIDSPYDSIIHQASTVMIVSREYIRTTYPDIPIETLMNLYTGHSQGLTIMTFGGESILYSRANQPIHSFTPFSVEVKSTLGAGDTFRAGVVYGVYNELSDLEIVEFASATAGCVISRFPFAYNPPTLDEINRLIEKM